MADKAEATIKPEDFLSFLKTYAPERNAGAEKDILAGRYRILTNQPLAEFSTSYAAAYAVRDEQSPEAPLYALVYENGMPLRQKNIAALKGFRHPNLISLVDEGQTEISAKNQLRYVAVLERPAGTALKQSLAQGASPLSAGQVIEQYLRPLSEILLAFARMGISHNRINPANIYIGGAKITLGECISEPSGFTQDPLLEPIERVLCLPRGKADYAPSADCYALAVLALELTLGFIPFEKMDKDALIHAILNQGPYQALILPWDTPVELQDFFRGIFGDSRRERWDANHIASWLGGRRFNLILPNTPRETTRGFEFERIIYYDRKSLAHGLWQHWKTARQAVADNGFTRWLAAHAHHPETADAVRRLSQSGASRPVNQDDLLARVIALLDPSGPLRFRHVSTSVEAIGPLLAHAVIAERDEDIRALTHMVESELPLFWIEQQKASPAYAALVTGLQKARRHLRMKGPGFGVERFLYDLNPNLPCLSPLIAGNPAMTVGDVLGALDTVAARNAAGNTIGDAHIAAFLASRLNITKEVNLAELTGLPQLSAHPTLIMLKLLSQAQKQDKAAGTNLNGLTHWLGARLLPLFEQIHNHARKRTLRAALLKTAAKGSLTALASLFLNEDSFTGDQRDFRRAAVDYAARKQQIAALKSADGLIHMAAVKGRGVAQSLSYGVCLISIYFTLKSCFHL